MTKDQMAKRIAELEAQLIERARENEALQFQLCVEGGPTFHRDKHGRKWLRTTSEGRLCYRLLDQPVAPTTKPRTPSHFAAARAMAIALGRSVKVATA
jgi:hypothetical protein